MENELFEKYVCKEIREDRKYYLGIFHINHQICCPTVMYRFAIRVPGKRISLYRDFEWDKFYPLLLEYCINNYKVNTI